MPLANAVIVTLINSALFLFFSDVYRRKTYRDKWKYQLITLMVAVFVCEMAMLFSKLQEVIKQP